MSSRHYWPEPPKDDFERHLVESENGEVLAWHLYPNGKWGQFDNADMEGRGYLGVRKPFDEEAERVEFEAVYKEMFPKLHQPKFSGGMYGDYEHRYAFRIWLAAKQHERGL